MPNILVIKKNVMAKRYAARKSMENMICIIFINIYVQYMNGYHKCFVCRWVFLLEVIQHFINAILYLLFLFPRHITQTQRHDNNNRL